MANCGKEIILAREGTNQQQRFIEALNPDSARLNDFSLKEWLQFAYNFAKHVNYFSLNEDSIPSGDWQEFFVKDEEIESFLSDVESGKNITPHLALFVAFVQLIGFTQNRFNKLTRRHLDFYYENILKIGKLPPTPDKVHVIFELAKSSLEEKLDAGTKLDGGKDAEGIKRIYKTDGEFVANKIKVGQLKNLYNDHVNNKIKASEMANSFDGNGADFPGDKVSWWPFGQYNSPDFPELPDAKIGFAVASNVLKLKEGNRYIRISIEFSEEPPAVDVSILTENIEVFCSGEKEWLGPFTVQPELNDRSEVVFSSGINSDSKKLMLAILVPKDEKPVVNYDGEVLNEKFKTEMPVCRILLKTENEDGHKLYRQVAEKEIKNLSVDVDVRDVENLFLENDFGTLNAAKPFYPFGTQPVRRSNFYVDYPELFSKKWNTINVDIGWKNTPVKTGTNDAFVDLYFAYRTCYLYQTSSSDYLKGIFYSKYDAEKIRRKAERPEILESGIGDSKINFNPANLIVTDDSYFKALVEIRNKEEWITLPEKLILFESDNGGFSTGFPIINEGYEQSKNGPLRLSLNQTFLHELYPRIYALALGSGDTDALVPNEPYTPMVETIKLNYTASASSNFAKTKEAFENNPLNLFHEHPFGQSEQHPFLKEQHNFLDVSGKKTVLVPTFCKGGELFIGLENARPLQQLSLLVQVMEGSENPEADSFTGKQKVEWFVLCEDEWKILGSDFMVLNETNNFLKSGIIRISLPREATDKNTRLPAGMIWLKARIHKNYDAVCKAIAIYAQAALAIFDNNENELSHLKDGLSAETITKPVQRISQIKDISQPFSSFGGVPPESDAAYYRRVSERLRHKNRAITLWDYEHLILQHFPEVHKVKCLNHTSEVSFLSPGDVLIIVIPDIINQNVFDIYQPRLSKAVLNAIQSYVNNLNSFHVNAVVRNPDYEEVTVDLRVKFREGFDANFYSKKLNEDITRFLSPWAFDSSALIRFGKTLHQSAVINYIEKLGYVDFLANVKLVKNAEPPAKSITPESPKSILVSAKQHHISTDIENCNELKETEEKCQT